MRPNALGYVGAVVFLVIRGMLLWFIIPFGTLVWIITFQWIHERPVSLGAFLGWIDCNLAFVLTRGLLRPAFPDPNIKWIPARERSTVKHRIGILDPL